MNPLIFGSLGKLGMPRGTEGAAAVCASTSAISSCTSTNSRGLLVWGASTVIVDAAGGIGLAAVDTAGELLLLAEARWYKERLM